jgi:hypothetical protein
VAVHGMRMISARPGGGGERERERFIRNEYPQVGFSMGVARVDRPVTAHHHASACGKDFPGVGRSGPASSKRREGERGLCAGPFRRTEGR